MSISTGLGMGMWPNFGQWDLGEVSWGLSGKLSLTFKRASWTISPPFMVCLQRGKHGAKIDLAPMSAVGDTLSYIIYCAFIVTQARAQPSTSVSVSSPNSICTMPTRGGATISPEVCRGSRVTGQSRWPRGKMMSKHCTWARQRRHE